MPAAAAAVADHADVARNAQADAPGQPRDLVGDTGGVGSKEGSGVSVRRSSFFTVQVFATASRTIVLKVVLTPKVTVRTPTSL